MGFKFFLHSTLLIVGLFSVTAVGKTLTSKKDDVKVLDAANKDAKVLSVLKKDATVEASERKGMYWEVVLANGVKGYVSVMSVDIKKAEDNSTLSSALRSVVQNRRNENDPSNNRERSTVMGVRGLDDSKETSFAGTVKPNLRMVYQMEGIVISKNKVAEIDKLVQDEIEKKMK